MEDKTIVFTFKKLNNYRGYLLYTKSALADKADKEKDAGAIDFAFYMKTLSKKYNDRGVAVLFDYEG